jgi:hypothetical protein
LGPFYEATTLSGDAAMHRRAAGALRELAAACARRRVRAPETLPRLAWFLNRAGHYDEVVAVSETAEARRMQGVNGRTWRRSARQR